MKHKLIKNLSLSLVSFVLFFTLAEITTRLFWNPEFDNPHEGVILEGENRALIHEGILYETNSLGIRNKEIPFKKDKNTIRILALGDSFIWGDGLPEDDLITTKLEIKLNDQFTDSIEVINAGIGGFNTKDEWNQLQRLYPIYKPNAVIQFFFTNDIIETDSSNKITKWNVNLHMWLRKNVKFYSFLYYLIKSTINAEVSFPAFILPSDYFNIDDTKPGWVAFKEYTSKIRNFCSENNLDFIFVFIPTLTNLDENYPYMEVKEKVTQYIVSSEVPFISFFDLFSEYKPIDLWVSKENTHWNGKATSLAAKELSDFIIKNELLSTVK